MNVFEFTERPHRRLFVEGYDPNDLRMGAFVKHQLRDYEYSQVVILGCPDDEGIIRNQGRPGARKSPREIRCEFYKLAASNGINGLGIMDLGDVLLGSTLEETHSRLRGVVGRILKDGKMAIVLGGGNDISYPDCAALMEMERDVLVFNIDKHFDVRDISPRNSGTAYRQLLDEGLIDPGRFYEIGSEEFANSPKYLNYLMKRGANVYPLDALRSYGIKKLFQDTITRLKPQAIFWGFDLDVVRDSDAPGVSASYPTGLTAAEIIRIAQLAGEETKAGIVEFTEVNPDVDIDNRTSKLVAILMHTFLTAKIEGRGFGSTEYRD
jgi:formiminoglutamase